MTGTLFTLTPEPGRPRRPAPALHIVVYGTPAAQGSKKFVGFNAQGHAKLMESSKKVLPWREAVRAAAWQIIRCCDDDACGYLRDGYPLDGPLAARVVFTLNKPASAPKRRRTWPDRIPDLSKLLRSTEDALQDIGAIKDDARLVEYRRLAKVYPGEDAEALDAPGVLLSIWRVTTDPSSDVVARGEAILANARPYRPDDPLPPGAASTPPGDGATERIAHA